MNLYKDAPIVKIVMLKGADGDKSKLSELQNDMTFLTEEQIITLVTNIVDTGEVGDIDTGFVTRLKEQNRGKQLEFWVGTQAEYDQIELAQANTFYIITDDNFKEETEAAIAALNQRIDDISYTDVDEEIADLQTRVTNAESDIDDLETASTDHGDRITTLEGKDDESRYKAGDNDTLHFACGGLMEVRSQGGHGIMVTFDIPLNKRLSGVTLTMTGLDIKFATSTSSADGYVKGGAGSNYVHYTQMSGTTATTGFRYTVYPTHLEVEVRDIVAAAFTSTVGVGIMGTADITIS